MKAIMVMFDSLNRRMLAPYGCDWVQTPNFKLLAERTVVFDNSYVGSMPCMPARRELHTGRYNFLHREWGPLEPFDDSAPEILKNNGVSTHLISDHYHYWEDGGATYHSRYSTWEAIRGQEGDPWKADLTVQPPETLNQRSGPWLRQDFVNRRYQEREEDMCQPQTFAKGLEFLRTNRGQDNWFLQLETFDPHEPYFAARRFQELYPHEYSGPLFDWPPYRPVTETPEQVNHLRMMNAALVSMCDFYLGSVIALMDELDLWKDTLLIVNTDHGFLLGEHGMWAKCWAPMYNEVAHSPLFLWDPRSGPFDGTQGRPEQRRTGGARGARRKSLVQTIDLPATLLEYFNVARPQGMQGVPLRETIATDKPVRETALFGQHGAHVNVTDGRYVYMRAPASPTDCPAFNYTLMPTRMRGFLDPARLRQATIAPPFPFTRGMPLLKIPTVASAKYYEYGTMLFDLESDPGQLRPIRDAAIERRMIEALTAQMEANDAPKEQFERLGLR